MTIYHTTFTSFLLSTTITFLASPFAVINQTTTDKNLEIFEAQRPTSDKPTELKWPEPLNPKKPHTLKVPAKSKALCSIQPCSVILVSVVTTTKQRNGLKKSTTTSKTTTCYEPYNCDVTKDANGAKIDNNWGLVIHNPLPAKANDDWMTRYHKGKQTECGYGIKCLHPKDLEKVTSLDELPQELT